MATTLFFSFLGSLVICMALIPPLMASAGRLHILDVPRGRRIHSGSVAKVGGIALAVGTFIGVLMWAPRDEVVVASLLGGLTILLFGIWDDRVGLSYRAKFAGQAVAAFTVLVFGGVQITSLPLVPDEWFSPWIGLPLTFVVLIAVTNAVNLADGLDGLAGGLSLISFAGMAYLAFQTGDPLLMLMIVSVLGGLLGFLRFNTYPARIFMGDAGSQFLGFYLGVTGLVLTHPAHGPYSFMLALFIWGLPLLDTLGVMIQRWREGRSPFIGDRNHLHHKLLGMGCSHRGAVMLIYTGQTAVVALGYALRWQADWLSAAIYLVVASGVLLLFLRPVPRVRRAEEAGAWQDLGGISGWLEAHPRVAQAPIHLLAAGVIGFLMVSVLLSRTVSRDAGLVAAGLLIVVVAGRGLLPRMTPFWVRVGLYVGSTFVLYFGEVGLGPVSHWWGRPVDLVLIGVAALVLIMMRLGASGRFETTPLDSLMILLALVLPFLPELQMGEINVSLLAAKLIVLFFSFELLLHAYADRVTQAWLATMCLLGGLAVRAWW
jgi:UDP-GlcNAc:undecaprenyl-phosphate/decaprenyl-phosphate GlcNAc-1-phosphate transferase